MRLKKPCAYQGCPKLIEKGERYCEVHKKIRDKEYDKYGRGYNHSKRYNSDWSRISKAYRKAHPLCEKCLEEGRAVTATLVHHKKPIAEGGTNETDNLQSLCNRCHGLIHGERGDYTGKQGWGYQHLKE